MEKLAGKIMLTWGIRRVGLAVAAGALGALALPPVGLPVAMFIAFPLLVWLLDGATGRAGSGLAGRLGSSFAIGWLFGLGYFVAGLWWIGNALMVEAEAFAWALPLAVLGLPAVLALYYGLAAALARLFWSDGMGRLAALAAAFGLAEYLRGVLLTGFPWNAIGYAAMPVPLMMQSAHVIGLAGVTTLSVFVFAAPALLGTRRGLVPGLLLALGLAAAHLGYGAWRLQQPETPVAGDRPLTYRLVQPSIDQSKKIDDRERASIFEEHLAMTAKPPAEGAKRPDVIVWPETSIPFILTANQDALTRIADVLADDQLLVAGAVREENRGAGQPPRYTNSIYVIDGKGQILGAADKVHLVPFGEYVPFGDWLESLGLVSVIDLPGGFSPGAGRSLLGLPDGTSLYPLICYEIIFPEEMTGDFSRVRAILNVTNDAWFGNSPGPYQHFQQAQVRAVETGLPLIRSANSGISAFVTARGEIISGLGYNVKATVEATLGSVAAPEWAIAARQRNFWLLIGALAAVAVISRLAFVSKTN